MARPQKARRSFRIADDDVDEEPKEDFNDELRTRRSINRVEDGPVFKSLAKQTGPQGESNTSDFFLCLKMAAENKIGAKNAFALKMIDHLDEQVKQQDSAVSKNFQLASCSLDAGTKIYAARVDVVAKDMTDFSMTMAMGSKNGGEGEGVEDEDARSVEAKKRKIKRMRRNKIFGTDEELQLDFSKLPVTKSVFSLVGNLFNEAIDSFEFTDRGSNGAIPELMPSALETCEPDSLMEIKLPRFSDDSCISETLENFVMGFHLSDEGNDMLNNSFNMSMVSDSPNLSLKDFNPTPLEDDPVQESLNHSFDASVMEENVEAYGGGNEGADLVADRTPSFTGHMQAKKMVHDGRHIQLQGPTFWKYKKTSYPQMAIRNSAAKKAGPKHEPLDFTKEVDLTRLLKKKSKVTLQRETLVKWSSDKITLPFETFEGDADCYDLPLDITKYSLMPNKQIHNTEPIEAVQDVLPNNEDDFFNVENFPEPNEVDHGGDDSDDEHAISPLVDDEDAADFQQDLQSLLQSNLSDNSRHSHMTNLGLEESKLISAPDVVETVLPEWKPARRFNMKKLESRLWEQVEEAAEGGLSPPTLRQLSEGLPAATQASTSVTTRLYALLNVCNKRGVAVASNPQLDDCQVQHLRPRPPTTPHPAIPSPV